jgi:phosphoribosylanthranilate isomerase
MWVKICANTCAEDALRAVELGADALGFVFAPSARRVTPAQVRAVSDLLPEGVERVGVFAGGSVDEVAEAVAVARLHTVQFHGDLDFDLLPRLHERLGPAVAVIPTLHWSVEQQEDSAIRLREQLRQLAEVYPGTRVLMDTKVGSGASGGTGMTFDWERAREVLASQPSLRIVVAGGLNPDNVSNAIRVLQPWGVDVASGVESSPGRKDASRLQSFIRNARGVV